MNIINSFLWLLFGFSGRIGRLTFWLMIIIITCLEILALLTAGIIITSFSGFIESLTSFTEASNILCSTEIQMMDSRLSIGR